MESISLSGTTFALQPELVGLVLQDDSIDDIIFPSGGGFFGVGVSVTNRVIRSDLDSSVIFAPRIVPFLNNTGANFLIDRVVMDGYTDFLLDVNYRTDGLGDRGPTAAGRSADGNELSFDFLFPLAISNLFPNPQEQSYFFSIKSDANAYVNTGSMRIFGRHLDYPDETFELNYSGLAVPAIGGISAIAEPEGVIYLAFIVSLVASSRARRKKLISQFSD
ncbi:hypothetical protein RS130_11180 [Paraglaciecola aquimarina]|uniref:PEP-CTERM protein-sorting domain-containing protein n=1 Tax=Paraglaciecola aquimarina TaxID=1235557 RepID=A0ABU3SWL6_9ALTE|nr:hypothetical protein [Paraglaciecola aquimarina]MDU0354418.1 hypothetical protein [Paraglaciecola aquimarina]